MKEDDPLTFSPLSLATGRALKALAKQPNHRDERSAPYEARDCSKSDVVHRELHRLDHVRAPDDA